MRKNLLMMMLCLAVITAVAAKKKQPEKTLKVEKLRTERLANPMSVDTQTPRLGWQIVTNQNDVMQTSARIIVASTRKKAEALEGDLWDYTLNSSQSQWIAYAGKLLRSNTRCYWRVKVNTTKGESAWSDVAMWNVGLLTESDWQGQWIGLDRAMPWDKETEHSQLSARYLRTEFDKGDKDVKHATLYISGLGMYEAFINGKKVGDQVLAPAPTDYRKTVLYNAFDVTDMIGERNAIGVALGNGRYYTMQQKKKPYKITNFGYPKLRLCLIIEYTDGSKKTISSTEKWKLNANGAIRSNNEYDGEIYDARMELAGWDMPGYDDSRWRPAERVAIPLGTLRGAMAPNMKVVEQIKPAGIQKMGDKYVVDLGQNMAGWLKVRISNAKSGDTVKIVFAEKVDSTGNLWRANFRHANSTDYYIANGKEEGKWWNPTFVYHGFRYAEVSGIENLKTDDFIGEVISDEMEETGSFKSGNQVLDKVYRNAVWGIRSNYKGMPVDCPQRDERQPWLGDRTRGCFGEAFVFDNNALYAKWVRDITEAEREDGCIPDVAPAFWNYYSDNVTWPAALPFSLEMMLNQYGDDAPMKRFYPDVKRWMMHLKNQYQQDGLMPRDKYGDWCVPPESEELIHSKDPRRVTDGTLMGTAYYYRCCKLMAQFAKMQNLADDARFFEQEADMVKDAFNKHFLHVNKGTTTVPGHLLYPDNTYYGNNTVTANILPLAFGMIDDDYVRGEVEKNIIKNIITLNGGKVSCGVIGIGWLMHALTDMGRSDIAWLLATNKSYPSWGYMAEKGATTIWELWNGDTANPSMNSGNHVMLLGDLLSWLYEDVAGIRSGEAGFKHIIMKPDFSVDEMDHISASYQSVYGKIVSNWEKKAGGMVVWDIEIPANTTADIYLADGTMKRIGSGKYHFEVKANTGNDAVLTDEFLYKEASFPQCHSASIVETTKGDLVACYFGGTHERNPDVCIWVSRKPKGATEWTAPQMAADGVFRPDYREACWNPVIYQVPNGELRIYFKIGVNVAGWKGWMVRSKDGGKTWSKREPLPDDLYGPIKNKPILNKGRLIAPTSDERNGWKCYFEYSDDMGKTWKLTDFVEADSGVLAIQPSILVLPDGRLEALCRTRSRHVGVTFSSDNGETWSKLQLIDVPNNNSGLDAVNLKDGRFALICNDWPIEPDKQKGARTPLSVLLSDDGLNWKHWVTLEDSPINQYSYPSIIQTNDGKLHAVYTWRRLRVKHVELQP
ncbi:MAG: family 78 glycoside hydrolase catalytic domain [Prevotella sp.]|nr:family 78 glycoside hydrolase catalytic domain [Prevotella sp.]